MLDFQPDRSMFQIHQGINLCRDLSCLYAKPNPTLPASRLKARHRHASDHQAAMKRSHETKVVTRPITPRPILPACVRSCDADYFLSITLCNKLLLFFIPG